MQELVYRSFLPLSLWPTSRRLLFPRSVACFVLKRIAHCIVMYSIFKRYIFCPPISCPSISCPSISCPSFSVNPVKRRHGPGPWEARLRRPSIWNQIPPHIRNRHSAPPFRRALIGHFRKSSADIVMHYRSHCCRYGTTTSVNRPMIIMIIYTSPV